MEALQFLGFEQPEGEENAPASWERMRWSGALPVWLTQLMEAGRLLLAPIEGGKGERGLFYCDQHWTHLAVGAGNWLVRSDDGATVTTDEDYQAAL